MRSVGQSGKFIDAQKYADTFSCKSRVIEALLFISIPTSSSLSIRSSLNGIYIHDVKLELNVFINSQYTRITGYTFDDLMRLDGTQFFELFHPDDRQRVAEHIERVVNGSDDVVEVEYCFKTWDGRWIWCLSRDSEFAKE